MELTIDYIKEHINELDVQYVAELAGHDIPWEFFNFVWAKFDRYCVPAKDEIEYFEKMNYVYTAAPCIDNNGNFSGMHPIKTIIWDEWGSDGFIGLIFCSSVNKFYSLKDSTPLYVIYPTIDISDPNVKRAFEHMKIFTTKKEAKDYIAEFKNNYQYYHKTNFK